MTGLTRRHCLPFLLATALTLAACGDGGDADPPPAAEPAPPTAAEIEQRASATATRCDLAAGATAAEDIADWLDAAGGEPATIAGRDAATWRTLAAQHRQARATAEEASAFAAYWQAQGGDPDPHDYMAQLARLAAGDAEALAALAEGEPSQFASMGSAALHRARGQGDRDAMTVLADAMLAADLPARDRAAVAAYLHELGREQEAAQVLDAVSGKGEYVALGSTEAAMYLARFIEADGVEAGIARHRERFGEEALVFALVGAPAEYAYRDQPSALAALLEAETVQARLAAPEPGDAYMLAPLVAAIEEHHGSERAVAVAGRFAAALKEAGADARALSMLVAGLARAGCSDACLQASAAVIESAAQADGGDWQQAWHAAQAASGRLAQALEAGADPAAVAEAAVAHASGRAQPDYLQPLLAKASPEVADDARSRLAAYLYFDEAPTDAIAAALRLAPADAAPDDWWNLLAGSTIYGDADADRRAGVRRLLAAWREGLCQPDGDPSGVEPAPASLQAP